MSRWKVIVQSVAWIAGLAFVLFACAGRFDLAPLWEYLGVYAAVSLAGACLIDPGLVQERTRPGGKRLERKYGLLVAPFAGHYVVAALDTGRYHWTAPVPAAVQLAALAVFAASMAIVTWAMRVNRFLSSVVRIQTERGHQLVTDGPYRFVRHPTYSAAILGFSASGIALGSWVAGIVLLPLFAFLLYRTVTEDAFLKKNLPGYEEYAARVTHRLLPGVW
jgi:protein-S-isoprenylcysteine O-methyltransferase Ste14